jgi:hypothetical protein
VRSERPERGIERTDPGIELVDRGIELFGCGIEPVDTSIELPAGSIEQAEGPTGSILPAVRSIVAANGSREPKSRVSGLIRRDVST